MNTKLKLEALYLMRDYYCDKLYIEAIKQNEQLVSEILNCLLDTIGQIQKLKGGKK